MCLYRILPILTSVNAIARFEALMEGLVERPFARLLRTRMQPIEVAKRLSREMEGQRTVGINRVLVPNRYVIGLSPDDYDHFAPMQAMLQKEMATYLKDYAAEHRYILPGMPIVTFERDAAVRGGGLRISTALEDVADAEDDASAAGTAPLAPTQLMPLPEAQVPVGKPLAHGRARVELQGASCFLDRDTATMGRGLDNDVVVEDRRVSRHHARLQRGPRGWEIMDLASTNGTFVNGKQVKQRLVGNGDTISLGGLEMKFFLDAPKR